MKGKPECHLRRHFPIPSTPFSCERIGRPSSQVCHAQCSGPWSDRQLPQIRIVFSELPRTDITRIIGTTIPPHSRSHEHAPFPTENDATTATPKLTSRHKHPSFIPALLPNPIHHKRYRAPASNPDHFMLRLHMSIHGRVRGESFGGFDGCEGSHFADEGYGWAHGRAKDRTGAGEGILACVGSSGSFVSTPARSMR